jgi:hypothetical protein
MPHLTQGLLLMLDAAHLICVALFVFITSRMVLPVLCIRLRS